MDKKLIKNYIYNVSLQLIKIFLIFFTTPKLYSTIGDSSLGISAFAANIAGWFVLFGILGINVYGIKQIAKVRDDKKLLEQNFLEILSVQIINMIIAAICYILYINLTVKSNIEIYYITLLLLMASAIDISWFFYGLEDFKKVSIRNSISLIIDACVVFFIVKSSKDLAIYIFIKYLTETITQAFMYKQVKKYISFHFVSVKQAYKNHISSTFTLFLSSLAISIYTMLDKTLLGYLASETSVYNYNTAISIVKMFLYFITAIGAVVLPRVSNVISNDTQGLEKVESLLSTTLSLILMMVFPLMIGMLCVCPFFIPWYLKGATTIENLIMIGLPIILIISISDITGTQFLIPSGKTNIYTASVIAGAVINFIINIIFIPFFKEYSAMVAVIFAEFTVTFIQYIFVRKIGVKLHLFSFKNLKYLIFATIMGVCVYFVGYNMGVGKLTTLTQGVLGFIIYASLLLITKDEMIITVIDKIFKRKKVCNE